MKNYYGKRRKTQSGYLICIVPTCQTKKSTTPLKTFEFPSDSKRRLEWISAIVDATVQIEEEQSVVEDLYSIENRRVELQIEISNLLGDHSYVCARHFIPEDIVVHPNVCRLTPNAVPSVFRNYPTELPSQFFKKLCQSTDSSYYADSGITELDCISLLPDSKEDGRHEYVQEVTIYDSADDDGLDFQEANTTEKTFVSNSHEINKGKSLRKKYRGLQNRYKQMRDQFLEAQNKLRLYNIDSLERDAVNNNEEARFLLEMLRSYTIFEKTRQEILSSQKNS